MKKNNITIINDPNIFHEDWDEYHSITIPIPNSSSFQF